MSSLEIPATFLPSKKCRTGYCWFPCNGIELEDSKGISRWRCARCTGNLAPSYTGGSNRNINSHPDVTYGINKDNPIGVVTVAAADGTLHTAFANAIHKLQFNRDLFNGLLIQWIVTNNISFRVVEQRTLRLYLSHLMGCVCKIAWYNICHCHMG